MAITDPSDDIQAFLTDLARQYTARSFIGALVFKTVGFSVGRGGYDPLDPVHIIPITGAEIALADPVYPDAVGGTATFDLIEEPTFSTRVYDCRLASTMVATPADYGLGELGIWAEVLDSDVPSEIGTIFLMALAHFPIRAKTRRDVMLLRVAVNY